MNNPLVNRHCTIGALSRNNRQGAVNNPLISRQCTIGAPTQNSVLGTIFFGIRDIVLDIGKNEFIRYNVPDTKIFFLLLPGIYSQIGIDCNQFTAGKRIDCD